MFVRSDCHGYTKMASAYYSQYLNYHNFSKVRGIKTKIKKLTNSNQLYPSLEPIKSWLLFRGELWSRDLLVKPSIAGCATAFSLAVFFRAWENSVHPSIQENTVNKLEYTVKKQYKLRRL